MTRWIWSAMLVSVVCLFGCASQHAEGVKSDYHAQWTTVSADTKTATDAARTALQQRGLKEVMASSTGVDGVANAKMADGTKVAVDIKKLTDTSSQVSVTVGTVGDPKLGADIAKDIKMQAERK